MSKKPLEVHGRALHYVFKIGDRAKNSTFFQNVLGMKVLRHEEFKDGCEANCNGPYENRWSKTMVGYGEESSHFVIELTYNYGVQKYELGNDLGGITIISNQILPRARAENYPIETLQGLPILISPDGYKFIIVDTPTPPYTDPITQVTLHVNNLEKSKQYWVDILKMKQISLDAHSLVVSYGGRQTKLCLRRIIAPINHAKAYGRIAFAVPLDTQPKIDEVIKRMKCTILTPLVTLDTPGKAKVRVIILADPDGHEICFVDEEGFKQLSVLEYGAGKELEKFIGKDPFQDPTTIKPIVH